MSDAQKNGYVVPPLERERRSNPRRPPATMVSQDVTCPHCKQTWELTRDHFVSTGDILKCPQGCGHFKANGENVVCCVEDGIGLAEIPLPESC